MNEKTLFTIAIIITLIGILTLLFISEKLEPPSLKLNELTRDYLEKQVIVNGTISFFTVS